MVVGVGDDHKCRSRLQGEDGNKKLYIGKWLLGQQDG